MKKLPNNDYDYCAIGLIWQQQQQNIRFLVQLLIVVNFIWFERVHAKPSKPLEP